MVGMCGETKPLIKYGIFDENSDARIHVAPTTKMMFVFPTKDIVNLLNNKQYPERYANQKNVSYVTAKGFVVPVEDIPKLQAVTSTIPWWGFFRKTDDTTEKGIRAVRWVKLFLEKGLIPLMFDCGISSYRLDIQGTDIIAQGKWKIQVKCDYDAGPRKLGGTGNLFIQTYECNPLKKH